MLSNLSLYYLNQMGITPWIDKVNNTTEELIQKLPLQATTTKLVILLPGALHFKAQSLLKQLLSFMDLKNEELFITEAQNTIEIQHLKPLAVLSFGEPVTSLQGLNCPIVVSATLEQLLANPIAKKQVFKELLQINNLITQ